MRLKLKPFSTIKALAATASVWTFCMAPVAQGAAAANQKQLINQFLKETKLSTKQQTVSEFWQSVRHVFPKKPQAQLDTWVRLNGNQPMPKVEAQTIKGSDGKEQVRLNFLMAGGKTMTMIVSGDEDQFIKINSQWFSQKDFARYNNLNDIVSKLAKDPEIKKGLESSPVQKVNVAVNAPNKSKFQRRFLTGREIAKLPTLRAQIDVLLRMREASETADRVFTSGGGKKGAMNEILNRDAIEYVWSLLLPDANAAEGPCVASGWIASYHESSCARANPGRDTLIARAKELPFNDDIKRKVESCATSGGLPCNPMIFGFEDNNGSPYCIKTSIKTATAQCDKKAPLDAAGKEKIIQSIVAAKGNKDASLCKLNGEDKVSDACLTALDRYTEGLRQHYSNAAKFCTSGSVQAPEQKSQWVTRGDIRGDQKQACDSLRDRYFDLAGIVIPGEPPKIIPPPVKADDCAEREAAGSRMDANGQCVCDSTGKPPTDSEEIGPKKKVCAAAALVEQPGDKAGKPEECGEWSWCKRKGAYIAVGAGLIVAGLLAWLLTRNKKKDKKDPVYETPAPVPEPSATVTVSPGTTIDPVDPGVTQPACDVPPNSIINGVCTPPTVVPPEPLPSEGGTSTGTVINGGVR